MLLASFGFMAWVLKSGTLLKSGSKTLLKSGSWPEQLICQKRAKRHQSGLAQTYIKVFKDQERFIGTAYRT